MKRLLTAVIVIVLCFLVIVYNEEPAGKSEPVYIKTKPYSNLFWYLL